MKKTKEQRFIELMGDYIVELKADSFPYEYIYRNMKGDWLIWHDQKNGYTWINWSLIWSVFDKQYNMKYDNIQVFMKYTLLKHFKIEGTTPKNGRVNKPKKLLKHFKIEGTTPSSQNRRRSG